MNNVITQKSPFYIEISDQIKTLEKGIENLLKTEKPIFRFKWIEGSEVCRMMHISKRTLQNYRDNGILPHSIVGGKIFYNKDDINDLMQKNYITRK